VIASIDPGTGQRRTRSRRGSRRNRSNDAGKRCRRLEVNARADSEPHQTLEPGRRQEAGEPGERRLGDEMREREPAAAVHGSVPCEPQPDVGEGYRGGLPEVASEKLVQLTLGEHDGCGGGAVARLSAGERVDLPLRSGTVPRPRRR